MFQLYSRPLSLHVVAAAFPAALACAGCSDRGGDSNPEQPGASAMSTGGSATTGGTSGAGGMPTGAGAARCEFTATGDERSGGVTDAYDYAFSSRPVPDAIRIGTAVAPQGEYSILGCRGSQNFNDPKAEQLSFVFYYLGRLPDVIPVSASETDPNLLYCFAVYRDGNGNDWQCLAQSGSAPQGTCSLDVSDAAESDDPVAKFRVTASGHLECPSKGGTAKGTVGIDFTLSH